jgi:hypothetical protein
VSTDKVNPEESEDELTPEVNWGWGPVDESIPHVYESDEAWISLTRRGVGPQQQHNTTTQH